MKDDNFTRLIFDVEAKAIGFKYDFEIAQAFQDLLEKNKDSLTPEQEQCLKWEFLLFRLTTKNKFASDGLSTERFVPMATFVDGSVFPDPNTLLPALEYFEKRAIVSKNPILKARYLDFLWEKSKSKSKHLYAIAAIDEYLANVEAYENEDAIIERLDGLQRATELCLIIEGKKKTKPLTEMLVAKLNGQIEETSKSGKHRWLIEMFELVLALPDFYTQKQIKHFIIFCEKAVADYGVEQNFHLQRSFLIIKAGLVKIIDQSPDAKKSVDEEVGKSYLDEAEAKSSSGIVKAHFLQEAIDHYNKMGDKRKVDELIDQMKAATKQTIDNQEFKQFSTTIEIKPEDEKRIKDSLGTGNDVPENMGTVPIFFPNWNHAVEMTKEHSKKFVFMHLAKKVTFDGKYPISNPRTPEQGFEDHVMDNFRIEVELAHRWLTGCIGELIKNKNVSIDDFKKFFSKLAQIDNDTYETVMEGLELYFEDKHFQAVCILAPQLEDLLRQLLTIFGGQTTTLHKDAHAFTEKNLNRILIELKPYISEELFRYISWVMDDYRGYNLRYLVGHGFFKKKNGNPIYSTALLHIFCLLIANTTISVKEQK